MSKARRRTQFTDQEVARAKAAAARIDAAYAAPPDLDEDEGGRRPWQATPIEREQQTGESSQAAALAVLDPPESGPPTDVELGMEDPDDDPEDEGEGKEQGAGSEEQEAKKPRSSQLRTPSSALPTPCSVPHAPSFESIVYGLDQAMPAEWPASDFTVDWNWGGEVDPVVGEVLGWNWDTREVCVVIVTPEIPNSWPWRLAVSILEMPAAWEHCNIIDLNTGIILERVAWYTRWNRAGMQCMVTTANKSDPSNPNENLMLSPCGGWLAVIPKGDPAAAKAVLADPTKCRQISAEPPSEALEAMSAIADIAPSKA